MEERFESFKSVLNPFAFLYNLSEYDETENNELHQNCRLLEKMLSEKENKDIDDEYLAIELRLLSQRTNSNPEAILKWIYLHSLE